MGLAKYSPLRVREDLGDWRLDPLNVSNFQGEAVSVNSRESLALSHSIGANAAACVSREPPCVLITFCPLFQKSSE